MNKSIAGYKIFSSVRDYERMIKALRFFSLKNPPAKFSRFLNSEQAQKGGFEDGLEKMAVQYGCKIQIIAYCLMPTHVHLVMKQLDENGISSMLGMALNSYAKYFNTKYQRRGPLFVGRFKGVQVESDEQLLHLTRYIHLNPTTAELVKRPEQWKYSSYLTYICPDQVDYPLARFKGLIDDRPEYYKKFVEDYKTNQQELALIKAKVLY